MASLNIVGIDGTSQGVLEASDVVFGAELNEPVVHQVAVALLANRRQGTHKTKNRSELSGGGAKPFRQKGTGRARQGSNREPQMRGGGTVHGPQPRDYRKDVPVQVRRKALCIVLSDRVREEKLSVLKGLAFDAPKTKSMVEVLNAVAPEQRKTLLVTSDKDQNVLLSARNLEKVTVRTAAELNALDVLNAVRVLVQEDAVSKLEERLT